MVFVFNAISFGQAKSNLLGVIEDLTRPSMEKATLQIIDMQGRLKYSTLLQGKLITLEQQLASGIYVVQISNNQSSQQTLLIVK